ncbi:ankyrin repeat-containing protein ITN1-like [Tripterygium wilfordii]|uniref:ankyrin repeat-containing protein ITN1-like n=1 Tax=Tripterygium wilfordii TaxID=458696 RepID=UPI0018F846C8|nr:ankyrin repeat-containing protein ITN1-like [Tripterygium wilfordii]
MTATHLATLAGHVEIVKELIKGMSEELEKENNDGDTALCMAAYNGKTKIAQLLVEKHFALIGFPTPSELIPVSIACMRGHKEATHFLYSVTAEHFKDFGKNNIILLNDAVFNNMFDIALDIVKNEPHGLGTKSCERCHSALVTLSSMPAAFSSSTRFSFWQRLIYQYIPVQQPDCTRVREYDPGMYKEPSQPLAGLMRFLEFIGIKKIYETKLIHVQALQLLRHICRESSDPIDAEQYEEITTALFRAVKNGITEIIVEIIQEYPDMMWKRTNDYKRDIFQYAIEKRQEKVFSLIYGLDARKVPLITSVDSHQNNMLHIAGYLAPPTQLAHISGAALQLQRELQWFQEVEGIMNARSKETLNKNGETPKQVFTTNHKDLVIEGEKWMKEFATACSVVGALIITIMFAAAFTVPGGSDGDTGLPLFLHKTSFMVYIVSDAIALFTSSASVLMFLGMLTSRYSEEDFLKSLPRKLVFGVFTLFCSITAMMLTFCAALVIMLKGQLAVIVPIVVLASFTVGVFVVLQFPLLFDILHCTYGTIFTRKMEPWLSK